MTTYPPMTTVHWGNIEATRVAIDASPDRALPRAPLAAANRVMMAIDADPLWLDDSHGAGRSLNETKENGPPAVDYPTECTCGHDASGVACIDNATHGSPLLKLYAYSAFFVLLMLSAI